MANPTILPPAEKSFKTGNVPRFGSGGAFSLDGSHFANTVIEAINAKYGAEVPVMNIGTYGTETPNHEVS